MVDRMPGYVLYKGIRASCSRPMFILYHSPPIAHVDASPPLFGPNTYQAISIGLIILLVVGIVAVVGGMAVLQNQKKAKKRFF